MTSYADIVTLISTSGLTSIDLADDEATLSLAEAGALVAQGVTFAADDAITIKDTAASVEAVTATEIAELKALGAEKVLATDRGLDLSLTQINAFAGQDIAVYTQYETMSATTASDIFVSSGNLTGTVSLETVALADGSYLVLYRDYTSNPNTGIFVQHYDAEGNAIGSAAVASDTSVGAVRQASVTALADGGYIVSWTYQNKTIFVQRYDAADHAVGDPTALFSATTANAPSVTALSDGGYIITAYDYSQATGRLLVVQRFDAHGVAVGDLQTLTSNWVQGNLSYNVEGAVLTHTVELANGNVLIVWNDLTGDGSGYGVMGRIVGATGEVVGNAFAVNTKTDWDQIQPSVTSLSNGGFAVAWMDAGENTIVVQVFDSSGSRVGSEITVNESIYVQEKPEITALEDGNFVVTWTWYDVDDPDATSVLQGGVYSQLISAAGTTIGPVTLVNTTVTGSQIDPQIVALKGGGYVIVWSERIESGTDGYEINAQVFDADGNKIGVELEINTIESGNQTNQKVIALAGGGFAVTWYTGDTSGRYYTRVFQHDTETASFGGTAATISGLTASDAASFAELGITKITVSDGGAVELAKVAAVELSAIAGLAIHGAVSVTVTATGALLDDLTAAEIAALGDIGVTALDASDNILALSLAQVQAFTDAGIALASGDVVTLGIGVSELAGLSAAQLSALASAGIDGLDLTDNAISITLARLGEIEGAGLKFAAFDVVTIQDSQIQLSDLTTGDIADLAAWGVSKIDLTDGPATLTFAQANAFIAAGIGFAADDDVVVSGSIGEVGALDAGDIAALAALGVDTVRSAGPIAIDIAQFTAFIDNGVIIDAGIEDVSLSDTGTNLGSMSTALIASLSSFEIKALDATDDRVTLSLAQVEAFQSADVHFDASDVLALSVTTATLSALTSVDLSTATSFGVTLVDSAATLDVSLATLERLRTAGLAFDIDFTARLDDTAANLLAVSSGDIAAYGALGMDTVRLVDSGAVIAGLSVANINALDALGVQTIDVTDGTVTMALAKAVKLADLGIVFEQSDTVIVSASSSTFADPDTLDLAGLKSIHVDRIDVSDNALTLSLDQVGTYLDAGIGFVAADAITVRLSLAEARALTTAASAALLAAGVDTLRVDLSASEVKALTVTEIAALGKAGVDLVDIEPDAVVLTAAQIAAFTKAGIAFSEDDQVTQHKAPLLAGDTASAQEGAVAKVNVLANDTVYDGLTLSIAKASVASGSGSVTVNSDGSLSVRYTGVDIDGSATAKVVVSYSATDGVETSTGSLVVTFKAVTEDLIGTARADTLTGGAAGELIKGLGGNDILTGLGGRDTVYGGDGNDRIVVGALDGNDIIDGGAGTDILSLNRFNAAKAITLSLATPSNSQTLSDGTRIVNVERLEYRGGNTVTDRITGGALADTIYGNGGNDSLAGGAGNDILSGGAGRDTLYGGTGADDLYGGAGKDAFVFKSIAEMGTSKSTADTIFDFSHAQGDTIDLHAIDANIKRSGNQDFSFIGTSAFHKIAGELRYEAGTVGYHVYGDVNGDGKADFVLEVRSVTKLVASGFDL